ncbi:Uncharacterised protein [Mycobacteroides abscessus subsp. abscessus]|uniref:hypothetical protein n=1 Tax=Mycobacteroides abscessus TaxID=36809 RepID=UPI000925B90F|nr:hypothetical protein [Mycobacteroides abscessus]MDO3312408.1 hypothetical protein [Mycobacteroides abscessus subsp. abscessus]MDO3344910.1 hypothetical protein [Mycobacteroides abscessus subsp. abscessus]SHP08860.1 Uncharacterised protein [Mycobacteroides abscessus subsp. abscessus]SHP22958.1 Uncharacterised protein [Mycobacteroides abscessus subsp. abscessus]SHP93796.1 Uncharacterised protein [Mycobacteroides abscessus subsp. abscessus]
MKPIVKWLIKTAIEATREYFHEHPEVVDEAADAVATRIAAGLPKLVDSLTNLTPWQWDDKALDGLAERVAKLLPELVRQFLGFGLRP